MKGERPRERNAVEGRQLREEKTKEVTRKERLWGSLRGAHTQPMPLCIAEPALRRN